MHDSNSGSGGNALPALGSRADSYGERIPRENSLYDWSPADESLAEQQRQTDTATERESEDNDDLQNWVEIERAAIPIYTQLRREQPNMGLDVLRNFARAQARAQIHPTDQERQSDSNPRLREISLLNRPRSGHGESGSGTALPSESLRSQAMLQSVRRHGRVSARSREFMQRYIMDRERYGHDSDERERWHDQRTRAAGTATSFHSTIASSDDVYEFSRRAWQSQSRSSLDQPGSERARGAYRRSYLEHPPREQQRADPPPEPSLWLQQAITYIAKLRDCVDYEDALSHAVDAGFVNKEFFGEDQDDFLWDLDSVPRPAETSWLAPGAVFAGSQHATNGYPPWPLRNRETEGRETGSSIPRSSWRSFAQANAEAYADSRARMWDHRIGPRPRELEITNSTSDSTHRRTGGPPDRWPVKVTIHAVDYDNMTIAATMEAYNVPSYNSSYSSIISTANANATAQTLGLFRRDDQDSTMTNTAHPPILPRTSSITTYLEGEILDLTTHTFRTESYTSQLTTDAMYWRKLEPFAHLTSDDDMVRTLVSQRRMRELGEKYILMRWKERCFIPKSNASSRPPASVSSRENVWDGARPWMNNGDGVMAETGEGCGLTISGFYYVCLRRSDGAVEGLYCDPESSPYQHLRLSRVGGGNFPVWGFR
ncbi:hypothetical protein NA57DRAFT_64723 [Rhizodiscina lignyota]|uniref:Vacuolar import and degradation protein-domain-containing protein n=1 Tax=Rhizodiscina lignyota TaxID=1504668 RepID=A0A9P4M8Y0_9PEZI|nr:hypothetical protein NA57DRAFT_64723 [Rhizodiscina lignyota]